MLFAPFFEALLWPLKYLFSCKAHFYFVSLYKSHQKQIFAKALCHCFYGFHSHKIRPFIPYCFMYIFKYLVPFGCFHLPFVGSKLYFDKKQFICFAPLFFHSIALLYGFQAIQMYFDYPFIWYKSTAFLIFTYPFYTPTDNGFLFFPVPVMTLSWNF